MNDPKSTQIAPTKWTLYAQNDEAWNVMLADCARAEKSIDLEQFKCRIALITLGENGMAVFQKDKPMKRIPTVAQEVFDVSGAGDTVIACYTLALSAGADPVQAAHISNCAAGIVVGKVGIAVVTPDELIDSVKREVDRVKKASQ